MSDPIASHQHRREWEGNTGNSKTTAFDGQSPDPGVSLAPKSTSPTSNELPPPTSQHGELQYAGDLNNAAFAHNSVVHTRQGSRSSNGLRLQTDLDREIPTRVAAVNTSTTSVGSDSLHTDSIGTLSARPPSIRSNLTTWHPGIASVTASALSSPALAPLADITPLPSPIALDSSLSLRRMTSQSSSRPSSRGSDKMSPTSALVTVNGETITSAMMYQHQRQKYGSLGGGSSLEGKIPSIQLNQENIIAHSKSRSISEYVPQPISLPKQRNVVVSGSGAPSESLQLRREEHLADQRGLCSPTPQLPTPPPSSVGRTDSLGSMREEDRVRLSKIPRYFEARGVKDNKRRRWRAVKILGEGTFSKVYLATSQESWVDSSLDEALNDTSEGHIPLQADFDIKKAVAVKVAQHGEAGGVDESKVRNGLKRELEFLKTVQHPSVVHLKAFRVEEDCHIFVMSLCAGGDLFELASQKQDLLSPSLIRRIFSELVSATRYLHKELIIHRDIKLENVLVNIPAPQLALVPSWQSYPYSVITLTDLGLSKRIDPASPLDATRCGSEEYCAPEIIMGQAYDGRSTDAWALGVLLFAMLENRLPFDPMPGLDENEYNSQLARTKHRIARIEYVWVRYGDGDGEPLEDFGELQGAREAVLALLRRARTRASLDKLMDMDWVRGGVDVPGGLKFKEEQDPHEL